MIKVVAVAQVVLRGHTRTQCGRNDDTAGGGKPGTSRQDAQTIWATKRVLIQDILTF
jgi:hypothetical protein